MLRPCIAHLPRSQKLNLLCCLCFELILHGAEVFSAHSSAQQRTAASTAIVELRLNLLMSYNVKNKTITHFGTQFWDTIVTRSIREVIDFLMSILSFPYVNFVHAILCPRR